MIPTTSEKKMVSDYANLNKTWTHNQLYIPFYLSTFKEFVGPHEIFSIQQMTFLYDNFHNDDGKDKDPIFVTISLICINFLFSSLLVVE